MNEAKNDVIVVNEKDEWMGTMEKMEAHINGTLHRAFSVFILNDSAELLLQQRAAGKYHSAGLWSNTCCSHPMPAESTLAAAHRRLKEEMGFDCELKPLFKLRYKAVVGDLIENEYDHIYIGKYNGPVTMNTEEVQNFKFLSLDLLEQELTAHPSNYTAWLLLAFKQFKEAVSTGNY
jgi:isopentenyl-diphosphate delta-isomerase